MKRRWKWIAAGCLTLLLTAAASAEGCVVLPQKVNTIEEEAFYGDDALREVIVPQGATTIGARAFANSGLERITLPASVNSIAQDSFEGCSGVTAKVEKGSYAYTWCLNNGLAVETEVSGVETPFSAFDIQWRKSSYYIYDYTGRFSHVVVPAEYEGEDITGIWDNTFDSHPEMKSLTLPASISYCDSMFAAEQTGLTTVNILCPYVSFYTNPFFQCPNLTTVTFSPDSKYKVSNSGAVLSTDGKKLEFVPAGTAIGAYVFPQGITAISEEAFWGCRKVTSVTIPDAVTSIGYGVFKDCESLKSLVLHAGLTEFDSGAVSGCKALEAIEVEAGNSEFASVDGVLYSADMKRLICCPPGKSGEFVIPEGVETIEDYAFIDCHKLTKITLPSTLIGFGELAFSGIDCEILVAQGNSALASVDGVLFSADMKTLLRFPRDRQGAYDVPEGTVSIALEAFVNCEGLTAITFPDSLREIGSWAFTKCTSLKEVTIPKGVTEFETWGAFYACANLTDIHVEEGNTACMSVNGLLLSADGEILDMVPAGKTGTLVVPGCVRMISNLSADVQGNNLSEGDWISATGLTEIIVEEGVEEIEQYAFVGHKLLERVVLPASINRLGGPAEEIFADCGDFVVEVVEGSYAHEWCEKYSIRYVLGAAE